MHCLYYALREIEQNQIIVQEMLFIKEYVNIENT